MNIARTVLRSAAIAGALVASTASFAQGGAPSAADHLKYRCIVLGEQAACPWNSKSAQDKDVPGPYARYLIDKGVAREEALAAAKAVGEEPVRREPTPR